MFRCRFYGDAGDSIQFAEYYLNGKSFSTSDSHTAGSNCAQLYGGGWWYDQCFEGCLTCGDQFASWDTIGTDTDRYELLEARMMMKIGCSS